MRSGDQHSDYSGQHRLLSGTGHGTSQSSLYHVGNGIYVQTISYFIACCHLKKGAAGKIPFFVAAAGAQRNRGLHQYFYKMDVLL